MSSSTRPVPGRPAQKAGAKPNIIFIMADDLGIGHLGCYGQELIKTPNIDRIATEGLRFTQCYSGSTVCAPSRSCLMTGMHTGHTTVRGNSARQGVGQAVKAPGGWRVPLRAEDVTVAEVLKGAGYATGIVGKWGLGEPETLGHPNRQGFDYWFGYLNQQRAHEYYTDYLWRNHEKFTLEGNQAEPKTDYAHDLFTKEGLDFVRRHREGPFFLYFAYTIPHGKYQCPTMEPYADESWPDEQKTFAAMVDRLDRDVGKLMALLKELGIDENTIVFFTSDNGSATKDGEWARFKGTGPFRGKKGDLYEGGIRTPMIVRWPGKIGPGTESDQVWAFWDFLPTAAEIAGLSPKGTSPTPASGGRSAKGAPSERPKGPQGPPALDGISVLPALLGRKQESHEFLYWEIGSPRLRQAVRMGDWKAVRAGPKEPLELYDLKTDIGETHNVADKYPDVVAKIEAYLQTARTDSQYWPVRKSQPRKESKKKQ
ncbi:hypothetical protein AMJ85_03955 [candidate division BRC1 bacterium SM23_51]|nr:MAG: hypothetical protein AMJ85_03955 [candidate division BRC1 bacterium SM23_51]